MECHFGDKDSCTDACKYYKTCIWSEHKKKVKENYEKNM